MHWNLGGNFAPVQMICQIDWQECPSAFANYVWCEVVTDVLDFLARDGMEWRVPAILVVGFFLLRMMYKKCQNCTTISIPDKEIISQVDSRVQDLELKINVLTYKLQYGTWPLPHEIQGTFVKRGGHNVRLSLSGPNNHIDWMRNLSLRRNHPCNSHSTCNPHIACQLSHLINWQNGKPHHHMQRSVLPIKYGDAKHSNSSSDRSLEYNSERPRKHSSHLDGINKLSKSEDLQVYHGKMHHFLSNPRRHSGRLNYKERISRDLSFYRRCCEFQAYERFTKTLEECKSFLRELNNSNKNLGLIYSSSDFTVSSNTDTAMEIHLGKGRRRRKKWNKNPQYHETTLRKNYETIEDMNVPGRSIMRTSSITNLTEEKLLTASMNPPFPTELITNGRLIHAPVSLGRKEVEQTSEQTLHEVKKRLESLYDILQNLGIQDPVLGEIEGRSLSDKLRETFQNSTETFEYITREIKYLTDGPLEESRMDVMTSNQSLKNNENSIISNIYPSESTRNSVKVSSSDLKNTNENSGSPIKNQIIMQEADSTPVETEDDTTVVSSNSTNSEIQISEGIDRVNSIENMERKPSFGLTQSMMSSIGNNYQLTILDIIAEEQSTGSSSERASACASHLRMNKQSINNHEDHHSCDESVHSKLANEKGYPRDGSPVSLASANNSKVQYFKADSSNRKSNAYDIQTLEVDTGNCENSAGSTLTMQNNCEKLYLKRYPGLCSLVEKQLEVDVRKLELLNSPQHETRAKALEIYGSVDRNALEMSDVNGSSGNCRNVSRTTTELKHSPVSGHENKTERDSGAEYAEDRCCELERLLSVNKWCLDQQEHNTIYSIEYSLQSDLHSTRDPICLREESSSLNTTPVSSLLGDTKHSDKSEIKETTIKKNKIDNCRLKNINSKIDALNNKKKPTTFSNINRTHVQSTGKAKIEIQSIESNTNTNTTDLTSLGPINTSEEDLRRSVNSPTTSKASKSSATHNPEVSKHVKQSTGTERVKNSNNSVIRNTKAKVRSNLTCARVRCSSVEPETNRNPGRSMQPKRSRSQGTEHRSEIRIQQVPLENKMRGTSPPTSITSTSKMFSKSNIPVLKARLETTHRTGSEITPRPSVQETLPTSMSWKESAPHKNPDINHENIGIEKNIQCMGEVKHPLAKNNEVVNNINPGSISLIESHSEAAIYVKIFTQDYNNTTGLMNPNKFLEYIKRKEMNHQNMLTGSQLITPRDKNTNVLSLVTNTQDCDGYKILATTSAMKHKTNDVSPMTMNTMPLENPPPPTSLPNFYFLSIEQKDLSSLEISLSVQNLQQLPESSENVLKKKELNSEEYATLIDVLHKAQNQLYLQEVYNLCKKIISGRSNFN